MMRIQNFKPFIGEHCETVATGNLLRHEGIEISEPMLFGLGEGLGFGYFAMKNMPAPFIGGRSRFEEVTKRAAENIGFRVEFRQTRSKKRAWENIASFVDTGKPVAAKLNCYFLDYFTTKIHFAAHYVTVHGYNDETIYLVDTKQQGGSLETSRENFQDGRLWKGPMASNALTWTMSRNQNEIDWPQAIRRSIRSNAKTYLNPPIKNFGATGIRKAASLAHSWPETIEDAPTQIAQMGMLMERAGTGGGLFRKMYAEFLFEASSYLKSELVLEAQDLIVKSSTGWTEAAELLEQFAANPDVLSQVSDIFNKNADYEEAAFNLLAEL